MIRVVYKEETDRWIKGDRYIRPLVRKLLRSKPSRRSGMQKVVDNFLLGLRKLNVEYTFNQAPFLYGKTEKIICFGLGEIGLKGIKKSNPLIAAIGFPYPEELPRLSETHDLRRFLQHSDWVLDLARNANKYEKEVFETWPAGIDTDEWKFVGQLQKKPIDVLIYNKIYWEKDKYQLELVNPIKIFLKANGYSYKEIVYGDYFPSEYRTLLSQCKVMVFLSAHESQGLAYQEALSSGVPVFAWNQGLWMDPKRLDYSLFEVKASSIPYFDERCGSEFQNVTEFVKTFSHFFESAMDNKFNSREYIIENLSIERSTVKLINLHHSI